MNRTEAAVMLTYVARIDHRTLGDADAAAFADLLDDLDFADCMQAAREHLKCETAWLTPAHIRARVDAMHPGRVDALATEEALPPPDADPDDVPAYLSARRGNRRRPDNPGGRPRPVAQLLAGFGRMPDAKGGTRRSFSSEIFDGYRSETARVRALVLSHPDLREALTRDPISYPLAEQWNGYVPPVLDHLGRLNTSPRRAALAALIYEAECRAKHANQQTTNPIEAAPWHS